MSSRFKQIPAVFRSSALALGFLLLGGCLGMPDGVEPVTGFEAERYLGKWYEIARLDHSFERGLVNVSAEYGRGEDGAVTVLNQGYDTEDQEWSSAEGIARFVGPDDEAYLKVSFFGPFYGSYVVYDLDPDYQYAFVSGFNTDFLWLLAREPDVSQDVKDRFVRGAKALGFDTQELIWVEHRNVVQNP